MPTGIYSLPLQTAIDYTRRWRESQMIKAFTIDVAELNDIINELGRGQELTQIRVYFGYKENGEEALVLCGVDSRGNDILNITSENGDVNPGTYDFTRPCPSTCDENNSPLCYGE